MTKEEITTFILQQYYDSIETSSGSLNDYMESVCCLNDLKEEELVGIYELQDISLQTGSDLTLEKLAPIKSEIEHKKMIRRNTVRFIKELEKSSESSLLDSQTRDSVKEIGNQILKKISFFFNSITPRKEREHSLDDIVIDLRPKQTLENSVKTHNPHILDLCLEKLTRFEFLKTNGLIRASGTIELF